MRSNLTNETKTFHKAQAYQLQKYGIWLHVVLNETDCGASKLIFTQGSEARMLESTGSAVIILTLRKSLNLPSASVSGSVEPSLAELNG